MVSFRTKKIDTTETLGEKLKKRRQEKKIRLEKIARVLNISARYLEALEEGEYQRLPGDIYARNFIKLYAEYLNFNPRIFLDFYKEEKKIILKELPLRSKRSLSFSHFVIVPKMIRYFLVTAVILSCLGYLGWEIKKIVTPPFLFVSFPLDDLVIKEKNIEVRGQTDKEAAIIINGQEILADNQGYFKKGVDLQEGLNIITIQAQKKHSRQNTVLRNVLLEK